MLDTTVHYSYSKVKQCCDPDGRLLGYSRHSWLGFIYQCYLEASGERQIQDSLIGGYIVLCRTKVEELHAVQPTAEEK